MVFLTCLLFDVLDGVGRLDVERDRLARERLDEDLHATAQAEHEVQRRLLLDAEGRGEGSEEG